MKDEDNGFLKAQGVQMLRHCYKSEEVVPNSCMTWMLFWSYQPYKSARDRHNVKISCTELAESTLKYIIPRGHTTCLYFMSENPFRLLL